MGVSGAELRKSLAEHSTSKPAPLFPALHRMEQAGWLHILLG